MTPEEFIPLVAPGARANREAGVPASVTIAQAAVESGWGERVIGNNLFGIKATPDWMGKVVSFLTHEYEGGQLKQVVATFREYASWADSIADHTLFLRHNPRYAKAFLCDNPECFVQALSTAGYSTNPEYAKLLTEIITTHKLEQYDV